MHLIIVKITLIMIGILWFLIVVAWVLVLSGCASNKQEPEMHDLLYREPPNLVYKSITIEYYKAKDVCRS